METIELYTRPGCPFCFSLRRRLRSRGIEFREINIKHDTDARALVRAAGNGDEIVPTVRVGAQWLVNPSVDDVDAQITASRSYQSTAVNPGAAHANADSVNSGSWSRTASSPISHFENSREPGAQMPRNADALLEGIDQCL